MPEGMVVFLPPGAGKTRRVWEHILKNASNSTLTWSKRIRETMILAPNRHVHRIWLRELAELAWQRKMLELPDDKLPEELKLRSLKRILREQLSLPRLDTFRRLKFKKSRSCRYLVLDEWHRLPQYAVQKCQDWNSGKKTRGWFLGGPHVKKSLYFVSATPVNPVLEDEIRNDSIIDRPLDDELCRSQITQAVERAACILRAFLGFRQKLQTGQFFSFLRSAGICFMAAGSSIRRGLRWKYPSPLNSDSERNAEPPDMFIMYLRDAVHVNKQTSQDESGSSRLQEYSWATCLVRTRRRRRHYYLYPGPRCTGGRSFGVAYEHLFVDKQRSCRADNWLREHPRIHYLLRCLESSGMIRKSGDKRYEWRGKDKAVVFCVHQGVALGLAAVLRKCIGSAGDDESAVGTNVHNSDLEGLASISTVPEKQRREKPIRWRGRADCGRETVMR